MSYLNTRKAHDVDTKVRVCQRGRGWIREWDVGRNEIKDGSDDEDERNARVMAHITDYGMRGGARLTVRLHLVN